MTSPSSNPVTSHPRSDAERARLDLSGRIPNRVLPALIVCPACHGSLRALAEGSALQCTACQRHFPIVDGIPLLIAE